jgi:hypothetical protein
MRWQLLLLVAGCATATTTTDQLSDANHATDGNTTTHDGPAMLTDAGIHDGPITQHDAPAGSCATPSSGVLAAWDLSAAPGNQASSSATMMVTGITAGPIARSSGITATAAAMSINSNNWPQSAAIDTTKYYTFTIQPASGCQLDLTTLAIDGLSSGTGPNTAEVATSVDTFTAMKAVAVSTPSTPTLGVTNATTQIELRVYGFGATASAGTFRIQHTLTISGSLH